MNAPGSNRLRGEPFIKRTAEEENCPACSRLLGYVDDNVQWHKTHCAWANREKLRRIHIVGGPGSGKTTLAHKIGTSLDIEVYELDLIAFVGPDYVERGMPERLADISIIANHPTWITEGFFILWTDHLLACADIIVWLDHVNWERSMRHTVQRFVKSALQEAKNRRGLAKFTRFHDYARHLKQLIRVFFSSRAYYAISTSSQQSQIESWQNTAKHLTFYKDKVIHCHHDEAVIAFLNYVHFCCKSWQSQEVRKVC
jgi:adenylate kinase family enzyme